MPAIEIVAAFLGADVDGVVQPARVLQVFIMKRLCAETNPIYTRTGIPLDLFVIESAGIYLNADFGGASRKGRNDVFNQLAIDDGRRTATEEYRLRLLAKFRKLNLMEKAPHVRLVSPLGRYSHCECAVVTALLTERDMYVNARFHMP